MAKQLEELFPVYRVDFALIELLFEGSLKARAVVRLWERAVGGCLVMLLLVHFLFP